MRNNFYGKRTEPDLRYEMESILEGFFPEISKAQVFVLRKMRRDAYGKLIKCTCVSPLTHEPDIDTYCPICQGEGFLWDESLIEGYRQVLSSTTGFSSSERQLKSGIVNVTMIHFYTRYTTEFTIDDKLVELVVDTEDIPIDPVRRKQLYVINTALDYRSDNGRLEYWRLSCYSEKRKFLNGIEGI